MTDALDLAAARTLAVEDAAAGRSSAVCPYTAEQPLERHTYLRWMAHERLRLAGFPVATAPTEES